MPLTFWIRDGLRDFSTSFRNDRLSRASYPYIIFSGGLLVDMLKISLLVSVTMLLSGLSKIRMSIESQR